MNEEVKACAECGSPNTSASQFCSPPCFEKAVARQSRTPASYSPTIASLSAKVERAAERGPVGQDIGAMSHPERNEALFGPESTPLGRMRIFAAETNDYTIRAAQIRPEISALLDALESMMREKDAMIERCARIAEGHAVCGCNGAQGSCMIDDTPLAIAEEIRALSRAALDMTVDKGE